MLRDLGDDVHYHMEVIMPPTDDVEAAIGKILAPFDENAEENEDYSTKHAFWDWWQLGGRYSGSKIEARVGRDKIKAFHAALESQNVTVSGLAFGKQELSPATQIPAVDALWREMCPGGGDVCTLFKHSGDKMSGDICRFDELPNGLTAYSVIIAAPGYSGELQAEEMFHKSIWNGVSFQETTFDGQVTGVVDDYLKRISSYREDYKDRATIKPDWLVVTVDYHN